MSRIKESDLLLPALYIISENKDVNTTKIKKILIEVFNPAGEDNELLAGRRDTKFTQIVRNLLGSHYNTNGMSEYTLKNASGYFSLTDKGQSLVDENQEYLKYLFENHFPYDDAKQFATKVHASQNKKHKLYIYSETDEVKEGKAVVKQTKVKERSKKLREAALQYYTKDGRIACHVCGFDFYSFYGALGEGYIQMHHEKPIYQYSDEGFSQYVKQAIKDMKPVCANCHCMVHRNRNNALTLEELKKIIEDAKTSRP